jgi:hypothetical protein
MSEASPSIGEMWPSMSRVKCHSEFEPSPQEALLQSEILFLEGFFLHGRREKGRSALHLGSKMDMVRSSGQSRPVIASLSLRHMALHCQRVPPIFVDLLSHEECLSLKEYDPYHVDSSASAP